MIALKKVRFTELVLRDGNQSQLATRMPFSDFADVLPELDKAGFASIEVWGGATFDTCLRYLKEDPWERLRQIRKACPNTKLQMLLRGQNLLGYRHYPDDVVRAFINRAVANGIDVIRIFDALNDPRNVELAIEETRKQGAEAQAAICYTISPIHDLDSYVRLVRQFEDMGATSLCIKDMAGIMLPDQAEELVRAIKAVSDLPLHIHTHTTTGMAMMSLLKSVEAGADVIDTAMSSFSGGTSHAPTETMAAALEAYGYDTGLNQRQLKTINDLLSPLQEKYLEDGSLDPRVLTTRTDALVYQVPGGMISNLIAQLKMFNASDRLEEVFDEVPLVRKDLGYPPLVTPMSQMVGVQAVNNVLGKERYANISREIRAYIAGEYGRAPGEINPELVKKVLGDAEPLQVRFADTMEPGLERAKKDAGPLARDIDDVLSYATFPQIAPDFFAEREKREQNIQKYTIRRLE